MLKVNVKLRRLLPFCAAAVVCAIAAACDGVPAVTITPDDAAADAQGLGADGSPANADGSSGGGVDGATSGQDAAGGGGKDAAGGGMDAATMDAGCMASGSDKCCGAQLCIRCNMGTCGQCTSTCTDPAKPECCYDSQGNGLTCKAAGSACP